MDLEELERRAAKNKKRIYSHWLLPEQGSL